MSFIVLDDPRYPMYKRLISCDKCSLTTYLQLNREFKKIICYCVNSAGSPSRETCMFNSVLVFDIDDLDSVEAQLANHNILVRGRIH